MKIKKALLKIVNFFVFKSKKRVYMVPHNNGRIDKYDLINYSADNVLTLLNYAKNCEDFVGFKFYLECYSNERMNKIKECIKTWKIDVVPIICDETIEKPKRNKKTRIKNFLLRYSCKTWVSCTPHSGFDDKLKSQRFICLSYSSPLKSALSFRQYDFSFLDNFLETSLLTASVHAAQYRNPLIGCPILGFPRNDNLFSTSKLDSINKWIKSKTKIDYKKIIIYAPTYRDYENAYNHSSVLGFKENSADLERFLGENGFLLITKFHPLQDIAQVEFTPHIISYDKTYDFSLYDLLCISDMLISDYSSVIHDYILTGKPIIINSFDHDKYNVTRGFAFEPIDYIFPNAPCRTFDEIKAQVLLEFSNKKRNNKYYEVQKMFHRHVDNNSSERVLDFFRDCLK